MKTTISTADPKVLRQIATNPDFVSAELHKGAPDGHKFTPGETCRLTGLVDFPEYNGTTVKISAIRQDGTHGKAYYIEGDINRYMNWVYEIRLERT